MKALKEGGLEALLKLPSSTSYAARPPSVPDVSTFPARILFNCVN